MIYTSSVGNRTSSVSRVGSYPPVKFTDVAPRPTFGSCVVNSDLDPHGHASCNLNVSF